MSPPPANAKSVEEIILDRLLQERTSLAVTIRELSKSREIRLLIENVDWREGWNDVVLYLRRKRSRFHLFPKRIELHFDEELRLSKYFLAPYYRRWRHGPYD